MKKNTMTPKQAFEAMFIFLTAYYERTQGDADLGSVLSDIQLNRDSGSTADPAAWGDWLAAIEEMRVKSS